jgi:chromosome segregation ATPase
MDDLTELQSRVAAAQERLQQSAEEERRYGLRLNDIVAIVEGSLARQRQELETLQADVAQLQATVGRMSSERDEAKTALIQAHNALSAAQTRLGQREVQNEQLRRMLMELLAAIESHKGSAMPDVMRRLEGGMKSLMQQDAAESAEAAAEAGPEPETEPDVAAEEPEPAAPPAPPSSPAATVTVRPHTPARGRILTVVAKPAKVAETAGRLALAPTPNNAEAQVVQEAVREELEELPEPIADEPEAVADIAMSGADNIVADPAEEAAPAAETPAPETATPSPKEQELVNALLDAEKRLIEAEALAGAANANSPVAEIIRRISQRTREITDSGAQQS